MKKARGERDRQSEMLWVQGKIQRGKESFNSKRQTYKEREREIKAKKNTAFKKI